MNPHQTTTETPVPEQADTERTETETADDTDVEDRSKAGREAAKYRRQLREVEAERDGMRGQVTAAREALLAEALGVKFNVSTDPRFRQDVKLDVAEDLFTVGGIDKTALFDEDGNLDRDALLAAVRATHETRPNLFGPRLPKPDMSQGARYENMSPDTFEAAFGPRH